MEEALNILINKVKEMKVNLEGLPLEYRARIMNDNINNDLNHIINELIKIKNNANTQNTHR